MGSGLSTCLIRKIIPFLFGLIPDLIRFLRKNEYEILIDPSLKLIPFEEALTSFEEKILPELELEPYDYQLECFTRAIKLNRGLILSPTASR